MAYTPSTMENVYSMMDGVFNIYRYISTDSFGTITAGGYITDYKQHHMQVGDLVYWINQTTPTLYILKINSVSSSANTATLAEFDQTAATGAFTNLTASGTLTVTGASTLTGAVAAGASLTVATTLTVTGTSTLAGVTATSPVSIGTAASSLFGAYGTAAVSQRTTSLQATTNLTTSASFGTYQVAVIQEIMNTLAGMGLWKGS